MTQPSASRIASSFVDAAEKVALRVTQMRALMDGTATLGPASFGVLSAYVPTSKQDNKQAHGRLLGDLQRLGYHRIVNLKGQWEHLVDATMRREKSVLIPRMKAADLFDLGRAYDQDAVIYKSKDGVLGMYYLRTNQVELAVANDGSIPYQLSTGQDLWSKDNGSSFTFGFLWGQRIPWNGSKPILAGHVQDLLDRGLVQPVA